MPTALQLGNEAFRRADYSAALNAYLRSLGEVPEMAAFTLTNIDATRRRLRAQNTPDRPCRVVIACSDLARQAPRVAALVRVYKAAAEITVIGAGQAPDQWTWPVRQLDAVGKGSGAAALSALSGDVPELLHVVGTDEGAQLLAVAGRALWRCPVAVDLADDAALEGPFWSAVDGITAPSAGAAATCALPAQASAWLARLPAWRQSSALVLPPAWITLIKQQPSGPGATALRALAGLLGGPVLQPAPARAVVGPAARVLAKPAVAPAPAPTAPTAAPAASRSPSPTPRVASATSATATASPPPAARPPLAVAAPAGVPVRPSIPAVAAVAHPAGPVLAKGSASTVNLFGLALARQPAAGSDKAQALGALLTLVRWRAADPRAAGHPEAADQPVAALRLRLGGTGRQIADIGHIDDRTLRWRLDGESADAATPPCQLTFVQVDPAGQSVLALGRARCDGAGPHIMDIRLAHPLHPVLLIASDGQDQWLDASLLPFPSLCRGGMHHAELWMSGSGPQSMAELQATSNTLLQELLGQPLHGGVLSLGALDIDIAGATGAERLLQGAWRQWLAEVMGLVRTAAAAAPQGMPPTVREHLTAACAPTPPDAVSAAATRLVQARTGGLVLRLPADALPSLSLLTSRRAALPADAVGAVGAHALAHKITGQPQTLVSLPPLSAGLLAWQPANTALAWPVLTRQGTTLDAVAASARLTRCELPLAVRLTERAPALPSRALQPVPADRGEALWLASAALQGAAAGEIRALLVLDAFRPDVLTRLIDSLKAQTAADAIRVVVSLPATVPADQQRAAAELLQSRWPDRHRLIVSTDARRTARLNEAADGAQGFLLFLEEETLLHDARTAEALRQLAGHPGVASAACVLVREVPAKKGTDIAYVSGGVFPSQLSFATRVSLVLEEVVTRHAFPLATYPVLANTFRLAMVPANAWRALGGLDAERHPMHHADIDFGLRAAGRNLQHLCTSVLTASSSGAPVSATYADTQSLRLLPLAGWQAVLDQATVLRELGA